MTAKHLFFVLSGTLALVILGFGAAYYFASMWLSVGVATLEHKLGQTNKIARPTPL